MEINKPIELMELMMNRATRITRDQLLWLRGLKKDFFTRRRNAHKEAIATFWWQEAENEIINFGDEITRDIIQSIFGYNCRLASIDECELIGAGSILEIAAARVNNNTIKVWGSGFIGHDSSDNVHDTVFYAVRGEKTRARIGNRKIPIGDPGLLANIVYPKSKCSSGKIGVVAHYADHDLPIIKQFHSDKRFVLINPLQSPAEVAKQITDCRLILSSSLHGLIFSDSYNIPNIHLKLSDRLTGGIYKFEDYCSAVGKKYHAADIKKVFNDRYLDDIQNSYEPIRNLRSIQRALIRSFPKL